MDIDIKQQVKEYLLKENLTLKELVDILNRNKPNEEQKTSPASLNNKLTRGTIRYSEIIEIADAMGYNIIWERQSSEGKFFTPASIVGATIGTLFAGAGGMVGGAILGSKIKSGSLTGGKDTIVELDENTKNNYTNEKEMEMELYEERLDMEHFIEVNTNIILDEIVINCNPIIRKRYDDLIQSYILIKSMPVSFKLTSMYRVIFKLLSVQSDVGLRELITRLRNIYAHGGLLDVADDELQYLYVKSLYYRKLLTNKERD